MKRGSGIKNRKRMLHRWLALMVSVALLMGQGGFHVRAEELHLADDEVNVEEESSGEGIAAENVAGAAEYKVEQDIEAVAETGAEQYSIGQSFYFPEGSRDEYKILSENQVELVRAGSSGYTTGKCVIHDTVTNAGTVYTVTSIGNKAFRYGTISEVEIPDTVTSIGQWAFSDCSSLKIANIPNGITTVSDMLFAWSSLEKIEIPDTVTSIGGGAFRCCNLSDIRIPDSVTTISYDAFCDCKGLTSVQIPDSVTKLGANVFAGCDNLVSVKLSENLECIEARTFLDCPRLAAVTIPESVESVGEHAFWGCAALESITIPSGVTYLDEGAFRDCNSLQTLKIAVNTEEEDGREKVMPISLLGYEVFADYESEKPRMLIFLTQDGKTELSNSTSPTLARAQEAYQNVQDGNAGDNYWYGWYLGEIPAEYNISYYVDGVDVTGNDEYVQYVKYTEGAGITLPILSKADFTFDGWYKNADYTGDKVTAVSAVDTGDKVFYARWISNVSDDTPENSNTPDGEGNPDDGSTSDDTDIPEGSESPEGENNSSSYGINDSNITEKGTAGEGAANDKEPKTGDTSQVEIYATIAMIAGLLYLLLYFADKERGMTEEEKNELVSALIRWAKRGGCLRRYTAIAAIFCLLCYYHSIGQSSAVPKEQVSP